MVEVEVRDERGKRREEWREERQRDRDITDDDLKIRETNRNDGWEHQNLLCSTCFVEHINLGDGMKYLIWIQDRHWQGLKV
jgi:hypothetical protein